MKMLARIVKNVDGQVLVLFALLLVVIMGFAALVVDVGAAYSTRATLQKAADAAALAGAQDLQSPDAYDTAVEYAGKNGMKATENGVKKDGDTVTVTINDDSDKIEVECTRNIKYTFASVIGFTDAVVSARAVAINTNQWNGEALPFVNMGDPFNAKGDLINVWGSENVAPGNKERIHDDVVDYYDHSIVINIRDDNNGKGPYLYMKGGVSVGSEIETPLTNIVQEGKTVYVFSLRNDLIDEKNTYANKIKNINKYHLPMSDIVLLKCTVVSDWSKSEKTVKLEYQEVYNWDAVKETFIITDGKVALVE